MVAVMTGIEMSTQLWDRSLGQDAAPCKEPIWERKNTLYLYTIAEYTPNLTVSCEQRFGHLVRKR